LFKFLCLLYYESFIFRVSVAPLSVKDLTSENNTPDFKISAVNVSLQLLEELSKNLEQSAEYLIVEPFLPLLSEDNFHKCVRSQVKNVTERITLLKQKPLYRMVVEKKKPKPLKQYEPKIEDV